MLLVMLHKHRHITFNDGISLATVIIQLDHDWRKRKGFAQTPKQSLGDFITLGLN
jgi:hypothetical protein